MVGARAKEELLPATRDPLPPPGAEPADAGAPPRRPWWVYAVPWTGRVPQLPARQWRILGLLACAELFENYDLGIFGLALPQIQLGLGIPEDQVGNLSALLRLGTIPALAITVLADRIGRRRLLLATILGFTACTFATTFVRDTAQFAALQLLARVFVAGETMLAVVVLAEELKARDRGWGIGMLGALGAMGHGLAAIVFGFVEILPFGWRALYAIGALPMGLLAWFRRGLPETGRFQAHRAARGPQGGWRAWAQPMRDLVTMYPGRVAVIGLAVVPLDFVLVTASLFMAKTLQEVHGYAPGEVTVLYLVGGALGILGNIAAGALSDRWGRRGVLGLLLGVLALAFYSFYNGSGPAIAVIWVVQVFALQGVGVLFKALGSELFPTSYRSTASGVRAILSTLGGSAGLVLESGLYAAAGSHGAAITWMLPALAIPPLVIWFGLPETATRELEEIAPER